MTTHSLRLPVKTRDYGGSYHASCAGKKASATSCERHAVVALKKKFKGVTLMWNHDHYELEFPAGTSAPIVNRQS